MKNLKYNFNKNGKRNALVILTILIIHIILPSLLLSKQANIKEIMDDLFIQNDEFNELSTSAEMYLFDGMYINYHEIVEEGSHPLDLFYSQLTIDTFNIEWNVIIDDTYYDGSYEVNTQTRIIENGVNSYFEINTHTPIWIFTDVSIGDLIPIGVANEGDHIFSVEQELILETSKFGQVEALELIDLTTPGGIAFYDKNTGILLQGRFYLMAAEFYYDLVIIDTNADIGQSIPTHDIKVELDVPINPEINNEYIISAEVSNLGNIDEENINLYLYYDDVIVNSIFIATLPIGESISIIYEWTPTENQIYNFTAYAPPVMDETLIQNNKEERVFYIGDSSLFDGMYATYEGPGYTLNFTYSQISSDIYHVIFDVEMGGVSQSGYWDVNTQTRMMENAGGDAGFSDNSHSLIWIFTDVSIGDLISICVDGEGDHTFSVIRELIYEIPGFGQVEAIEVIDITTPGGIALYEKNTGILLNGSFYYAGGSYNYTMEIADTNVIFNQVFLDHDLKVELDVPENPKINNNYIITVEVSNIGDFDEENVNLYLYYEDAIVNSLFIPVLPVGEIISITYEWAPTEYQSYNFTAYAPPVINETSIQNNIDESMLYIRQPSLFDGMYIAHTFIIEDIEYSSTFTYSQLSIDIFHVTWDLVMDGTSGQSYWDENIDNRIMENSGGDINFGNNTHTPIWIFTDVSIGDEIPITVDGEGDHNFYVNRELIQDFPRFGEVEVIEVIDMTTPGGIAWYEKNTGILLNGTFYFMEGEYYYNLEIVNTNAIDRIPPTWEDIPSDQTVEFGDDFSYDVDAFSPYDINSYLIDNSNFNVDANGLITNIIPLEVGEYWLEIRAYDLYDQYCSAIIKISVMDTMRPIWGEISSDHTFEFGDDISYDVDAYDLSGIDHYWISDPIYFNIDENGLITNVITVPVAEYWFEIYAYDPYGHYCSAVIRFKIVDTTAPTWVERPTDLTIYIGEDFSYDVNASDHSDIDYWIDDTGNFHIHSDTGLITNNIELEPGSYDLIIRAYDSHGNYCEETITIIVTPPEGPDIPGYEISILFVLVGISIISILAYVRKKYSVKKV